VSVPMRYWLLPLLFSASCYQVKVASGTFTCTEPTDRCPDGQICAAGRCVNPGDERDLAQVAPDFTASEADLAQSDVDLAMENKVDMADICVGGWGEITAGKIYACRRPFTVTGANFAGLCRTGYHVCTAADDLSSLAQAAANMRCNAVGNFFTSAVDIQLKDIREQNPRTANGVCTPVGDTNRALLGCGTANGLYTLNAGGVCSGAATAMRCSMAVGGWSCTSAREIRQEGQGGLLCCVN
jgi:hypothetical protein